MKKAVETNNFFLKNNRGISAIIVTLLMIVLSLVAVGVVWVVISNVLSSGTEQVSSGVGQLLLNLKIEKVQVESNGDVSVTVKRSSGAGEISGINLIVSDGVNSQVIKKDSTLQELGTQTFTITSSELTNLGFVKDVSIAPLTKDSSGKETVGNAVDKFDNGAKYDLIFENNLILDPLFKKISYWTPGQWTGEFVDLSEEAKTGVINSAKIYALSQNIPVFSDYVPVNPNKKYKFTLWIREDNTNSQLYYGFYAYNSAKTQINSYKSDGTGSTNYYFWNGDLSPSNSWKKITGYIMPCIPTTWTNPPDTTLSNYRMDCSTAYLRMRFYNYDGPEYATEGGTTAWYAIPRIEEAG